ncbi:hypothetical protein SRHO_G00225420 [Serrasalmus rhombeus]
MINSWALASTFDWTSGVEADVEADGLTTTPPASSLSLFASGPPRSSIIPSLFPPSPLLQSWREWPGWPPSEQTNAITDRGLRTEASGTYLPEVNGLIVWRYSAMTNALYTFSNKPVYFLGMNRDERSRHSQ